MFATSRRTSVGTRSRPQREPRRATRWMARTVAKCGVPPRNRPRSAEKWVLQTL